MSLKPTSENIVIKKGVIINIMEADLVIVKEGKALCTSLMVAEKFEKRHADILRAIQNLECSNDFTERNFASSEYKDATGRILPMIEMTRDGFVFLAMGFTGKEAAAWKEAYINAFNKMEYIINNSRTEYTDSKIGQIKIEMTALTMALDILKPSDSSRLACVTRFYERNGLPTKDLPVYVEKKRVSFSATKLLEDHGKPMSAVSFNKMMVADGFLEEKERPSSGGTVKKFKMLTEKGLEFGENLVFPKNEKEVQPYYFEDSFGELLEKLTSEEEE